MKYLKTFEDSITDNRLKSGDYVLVYLGDVEIDKESIPPGTPTLDDLPQDEVKNKYAPVQIVSIEDEREYMCRFTNGVVFMIYAFEIIRYLNEEEIEDYNSKLNAKKYNL